MTFKIKISPVKIKKLRKKLENIAFPANKATAARAGRATVREMKRLIKTGQSPIKGKGSFPAYKNPDKYPGRKKKHSPVNLKLKKGWAFLVGYLDSVLAQKKERGHASGQNKQPKRPTIPSGRQLFHKKISEAYLAVLRKRISKLIKKKV